MVKKSYAILLYNSGNDERNLKKRIKENFPEKDEIRTIYEHLAYFYQIGVDSGRDATFEFPIDKFCIYFHHFPIQVDAALHILTRAGYLFIIILNQILRHVFILFYPAMNYID